MIRFYGGGLHDDGAGLLGIARLHRDPQLPARDVANHLRRGCRAAGFPAVDIQDNVAFARAPFKRAARWMCWTPNSSRQNPTFFAPFRASICRVSVGVAISSDSTFRMPRIFFTWSALERASSPF